MCGIFGFWDEERDGPLGLTLIRRRGPDRLAYWEDQGERIWLGHARLSIQDLSPAGNQPMIDPTGRFVMVYNGEIYNAPELRSGLESAGQRFVGHSDTEVFLRLYSLEGPACFAKLNGIFAAAIWDRQERSLTLVRDAMGVKPLYVDRRGGGFAFASEMKALLRTLHAAPTVNRTAVARHLVYLWSPGRETIANGIEKLLPGEYLVRDREGRETVAVFANWSMQHAAPRAIGEEQAAAELAGLLEQAVRRQMLSDVPVGAFLSGGLDSSAVAVFATRANGGKGGLPCFTIDFQGEDKTEAGIVEDLPYARRVADHIGADLHVVTVGPELADRLEELVYLLDEPNGDPAPLNALMIAELARSHGITVLLSGTGGDDVFTGYRRHYALLQEKWWTWLPRPARSALRAATARLPRKRPLLRRVAKAFENADRDLAERIVGYFQWLDPERASRLLTRSDGERIPSQQIGAPLRETLGDCWAGLSALGQMLYVERRHFLADHNLTYTDKTGMAAGVEVRVPLLDPDLIAFADSLPSDFRQRGKIGKWIFKKAMEPYLPRDVIYRPKAGFGAPLRKWFDGPLKALLDSALSRESLAERGLFEPAEVAALFEDLRTGRVDATYPIFAILCIELWCRQFVDRRFAVDAHVEPEKVPLHCVR